MSLVLSLGLALQRQAIARAAAAPPANTALPVISGTAQEGQTLTASPGSWSNSPTGYAWQWRRGTTNIAGATAASYVLRAADVGATITVRVIATNAAGTANALAAPTAAVTAAPAGARPANTALPVISGTAQEGRTLTASPGGWSNSPTGYAWQWRRGTTNIAGATAASYVPVAADIDRPLSVVVTATNAAGTGTATSAATPPVVFAFELLTETGSPEITSVPNLRVSLNGGTVWQTLPAAGLTVVRDGTDRLRVSGFASPAVRDAALFHYEQQTGTEPNTDAGALFALFVRATGGPGPVNPAQPGGLQVAATLDTAPIGVS